MGVGVQHIIGDKVGLEGECKYCQFVYRSIRSSLMNIYLMYSERNKEYFLQIPTSEYALGYIHSKY